MPLSPARFAAMVTACLSLLLVGLSTPVHGQALVLAKDGQPLAGIWHGADDKAAATMLAATLKDIVGADFTLNVWEAGQTVPADQPAMLVGQAAFAHGLKALEVSASGDSYRVERRGQHLLMGGEDSDGTFFACSHLLETLGCRWFFANHLGTVIPKLPTITVEQLSVHEVADFMSRSVWGPNFRHPSWGRHNRLGGRGMSTGHA